MKCPNCGKEIADDSIFCEFCGAKISKSGSNKILWIVLIVLLGLSILFAGSFYVYDFHKQYEKEVAEAKAAREEAERLAEEAREKARQDSIDAAIARENAVKRDKPIPKGKTNNIIKNKEWIDLGLPSGTLWANKNEEGFYTYDQAIAKFNKSMPSKEQFEELNNLCQWKWTGSGYKIIGINNNYIVLPAAGSLTESGVTHMGSFGGYWSYTFNDSDLAWVLGFDSNEVYISGRSPRCYKYSVRIVQSEEEKKQQEKKKAEERAYKEKRKKELILQGYVDLGLPSGTLWKPQNEKGYYTYSDAVSRFGKNVPTIDQLWELLRKCKWELDTSKSLKKYNVRGPNGNTIEVPLLGYMDCDGYVRYKNVLGHLQSSTLADSEHAWTLRIFDDYLGKDWGGEMCDACCVRLAAKP